MCIRDRFESHVHVSIDRIKNDPWKLVSQSSTRHLITNHCGKPIFALKPDLILQDENTRQVLDTKWKLLDENDFKNNYQLKQADFYQLFAYGQTYQVGKGDMLLIYPSHENFSTPLPVFNFSDNLRLWVVPFCLHKHQLITGDLCDKFPALDSQQSLIE